MLDRLAAERWPLGVIRLAPLPWLPSKGYPAARAAGGTSRGSLTRGSFEALLEHARELNEMMPIPLTDAEVVAKCRHWWRKTERGENKWGFGQFTTVDHSLIDEVLMKDGDVFTLLMVLRRHHWGRPFAMANEMPQSCPRAGGGGSASQWRAIAW